MTIKLSANPTVANRELRVQLFPHRLVLERREAISSATLREEAK
jgi:hypothetical protein